MNFQRGFMTMNAFQSKPKKAQRHYAGQAGRWAGALLLTALLTACARITLGPAPTPTTAGPQRAAAVRTAQTGQATLELGEGSILRVDRAASCDRRHRSAAAGSPRTP